MSPSSRLLLFLYISLVYVSMSGETEPEPLGEMVDVFVPTDRASGKPRGFAFVTFAEVSQAEAAILGMDGQDLDGMFF